MTRRVCWCQGPRTPITGYRYYTADQLDRGVRIKTLCNMGFSLEDMASFLEAESRGDGTAVEALLEEQLLKTQREIARLLRTGDIAQTKRQGDDKDGLDRPDNKRGTCHAGFEQKG